MNDILDRVRDADPAAHLTTRRLDPDAAHARVADLLASEGGSTVVDLGTRRRRIGRRTGIAIGLAAVTAVGGTAAAVTLRGEPTPELVGVECALTASDSWILGRTTLDPLEACRRALEAGGDHLPADSSVFQLPGRTLIVGPRSAMPAGVTEVDHHPVADTRLVEFADAIDDVHTGVGHGSPCHTEAETRAFVDAARARLRITGYPTGSPSRTGACVFATVDSASTSVQLFRTDPHDLERSPLPPRKPGTPDYEAFWADVHRSLVAPAPASGWSGEQVKAAIHATAARYGIPRSAYDVEVAPTRLGDSLRVYEYEVGKYRIYTP